MRPFTAFSAAAPTPRALFVLGLLLTAPGLVRAQTTPGNPGPTPGAPAGSPARSVGIGTTMPDPSAVLELQSATQGVLFPRLTRLQRRAIANPKPGLLVYQTGSPLAADSAGFWLRGPVGWQYLEPHRPVTVTKAGSEVSLGGGGSGSFTDADNQTLTKTGSTISLTNGGSVPDADNQTLSIAGSTITISGSASSVTVPSSADNLGSHSATQAVVLNDNPIRLRLAADANHSLGFDAAVDGPRLQGNLGGVLGSPGVSALRWTAAGQVGIGTTSPARLLQLGSSTYAQPAFLRIGAGNGTANRQWEMGVGVNTANMSDVSGENYDFAIRDATANATRLLIDYNTGNVGVGTATPDARLEVAGQVKITGGSPGVGKFLTSDATGLATWAAVPSSADNLGNHTATQPIAYATNDADKLLFTAAFGANGSKLTHSIGWNLDYHAGPNNQNAGQHRFFTGSASGWQERMLINATGNVGIGTSNPQQKLDVAGTAQAQQFAYATPQTRTLTVPFDAFASAAPGVYQFGQMVTSANGGNATVAGWLTSGTSGQPGYVSAPVNLPDGAIITGLSLTAFDNDNSGINPQVTLAETNAIPNATTSVGLSQIHHADITTNSPNWQTVSVPINFAVHNDMHIYKVIVRLNQNSSGTVLFNVRLTYTVAQPE